MVTCTTPPFRAAVRLNSGVRPQGNNVATVYKTKIDWWIGLLLSAASFVSLVAGLKALGAYTPNATWNALLIGGPGFLLPLIAMLCTRYTIDGNLLIVRSGPLRWRISIPEISAITPTHNPVASPSLSLSRLRIDYGNKKSVLISPRDRDGFLRQIEAIRAAV